MRFLARSVVLFACMLCLAPYHSESLAPYHSESLAKKRDPRTHARTTPQAPNNQATNTTLRFRRLGTEQGLAQNTVFDVLQDHKGFLWIATGDGLCRWDGYNVKTWRHDPKDSTSLSNFNTVRLYQDKDGELWINTLDGVNKMNKKTGTFERYYRKGKVRTGEMMFGVWSSIFAINDSTLWTINDSGLHVINRTTRALEPVTCSDESDSLFTHVDSRLAQSHTSSSQRFIFACLDVGRTRNTFIEYDPKAQHFSRIPIDEHEPPKGISREFDNTEFVYTRFLDQNGVWWLQFGKLFESSRFLRWSKKRYQQTGRLDIDTNIRELYRDAAVHQDSKQRFWLLSAGTIAILDSNYRLLHRINLAYKPDDSTSVASSLTMGYSWGEYRPDRYWFGSDGGGMNFVLPPPKFPHYRPFKYPMCWSMAEDALGNLWVATMGGEGGGVSSYNLRTGAVHEYCTESRVYAIFRDSRDNIWVPNKDGYLAKLSPNGDKPRTITQYRIKTYSWGVGSIVEDRYGMLWIGEQGTNNVERFDPRLGRVTHTFPNLGMILHTDRQGRIWAGGTGVTVFDPADADRIRFEGKDSTPHLFTHYRNDPKNPASLANDVVKCFHEDTDGTMWIATITGLDHLDTRTGKFTHENEQTGMPNNYTYGILPDDAGNLWVSTNRGLSRFNPKTRTWRNYSPADGLQSYEFDRLSFCKLRDGRLVFGGVNGFNMFRPEEVQDNDAPPPVAIVDVAINDRPYEQVFTGFAETTPQHGIREVSELTALELGYNDNTLTFDFAALDYTDPARNLYAYKMEGIDKEWVQSGTLRKTRYAGLPSGEYTFRVKACNNDGVWNEEGTALRIRILPPFWRTAWFYALCGISAALVIGGGTRFVVRQRFERQLERLNSAQMLEREQMQRELALEKERGRIAKDIHDEVGPGMMRIAVLAEAVQEGNRASSEHITTAAQEVIEAMNGIIWMTNPKNDTLDNLTAYVQEKAAVWFERIGESKGMTLHFALPETIPVLVLEGNVRRNCYLCIKEALNNALKHAEACRVEIALTILPNGFEWRVGDNGKGFDYESVSRFSNGLANMRSRMEEIGGVFEVRSGAGVGTVLVFRVLSG